MNTLLPIPTPPVTISDPVEKLVDSVVVVILTDLFKVEVPSTSRFVEILTLALISKSLLNVERPVIFNVPNFKFPLIDATPTTSKSTCGNVLPIPTLLTFPSSLKTKLGAPPIFPAAL